MLVQARARGLRLIRQHDHALLAGELAGAWRASDDGDRLRWRLVLATALHDAVWWTEDRQPRLDPGTRGPHDFASLPAPMKRRFIAEGTARLEGLDPEVAALVRAHHETLLGGSHGEHDPDLAWLRFFDNLSLFACLTPPGALEEARPPWLRSSVLRTPEGGSLSLEWRGENELSLSPFLLASAPFTVEIPHRDLPPGPYVAQEALRDAWEGASEARWRLAFTRP